MMTAEFDDEEVREFLIESNEGLELLDQQLVQLEQQPQNQELISSVFRTIHSIKGTCGFFAFDILGSVTHITESILAQLRERKRELTPELITLILEAVDAVKVLLRRIEETGAEGEDETAALRARLEEAFRSCWSGAAAAGTQPKAAAQCKSILTLTPSEPKTPAAAPTAAPTTAEQAVAEPELPQKMAVANPAAPLAATPALGLASAAAAPTPASSSKSPAPANAAAAQEPSSDGHVTDSTIRVDINLLNKLMNLVGELVLTRNQLLQAAGGVNAGIQQTSQRLNSITTELQESVMKTRMQPIGTVWSKLPRVVRDLAAKCGKQVNLEMHGAETELDKSLIEAIRDPLTHIVRNSCDHGIESPQERAAKGKPAMGTLLLRAFHEAGAVNIEITDDGAGINPERVRAKALEKHLITPEQAAHLSAQESIHLIFLPGFSTAAQVTSISGRGVGMDVVKTNIEKISGSVQVLCPQGGGTSMRIKIPLTLAIIPGLIVACDRSTGSAAEERFVIPQSHLVEMTRIDLTISKHLVEEVNGARILKHRGSMLPLVHLSVLLEKTAKPPLEEAINIIILQVQGKQFGLVVDRICDTQEIVVKPLGKQLKQLDCYGGATIMGDGRPALILDVGGLSRLAGLDTQHKELLSNLPAQKGKRTTTEFILFRAGKHQRMALPLSIVNRLEELPADSVEYAAGQAVVCYRGELLPLVRASSLAEGNDRPLQAQPSGTIRAIVIDNGEQPFGLVVDEILDVVEESFTAVRSSSNSAMLGSAVLAGQVTDIVDVTTICREHAKSWNRSANTPAYTQHVAFYDPWPLNREMTRTLLDAGGYLPTHLRSEADLHLALQQGSIDLLLISGSGQEPLPGWLLQARRAGGALASTPTIVAGDPHVAVSAAEEADVAKPVWIDQRDRAGLLRRVQQMLPHPLQEEA